ncbi:MAG: DUF4292 domain-containing protein [Bacteroidales bacterium]|nr:DUF4292 domain-containing protein [Bacteroidales bacterium]
MFRKIIYTGLFAFLLLFSACSALRKNVRSGISTIDTSDIKNVLPAIRKNNISRKSFKISRFKAEIIDSSGDRRSVPGFLKYSKNGDVLISLRSMAGIEVARGLIDADSIKIYDRINKILYVQSNRKFGQRYGLNKDLIGLIWGDLPAAIIEISVPEEEDLRYIAKEEDRVYNYSVDKQNLKVSGIESWRGEKKLLGIEYNDFKVNENCIYPSEISIDLSEAGYLIDLSIKGISLEKTMNMNFKVDNNAERIIIK